MRYRRLAIDADLTEVLAAQRQSVAHQREDVERLEAGLRDLEATLAVNGRGNGSRRSAEQISVLFVCNGNSARSQMAEAVLARFGGPDFAVASAGERPKTVHPLAVRAMGEIGIDWRLARAKRVEELADQPFDYVITLSDTARADCPSRC